MNDLLQFRLRSRYGNVDDLTQAEVLRWYRWINLVHWEQVKIT